MSIKKFIQSLLILTPWIVLAVILLYTYALFFVSPFTGFAVENASGRVLSVYIVPQPGEDLLPGDIITAINGITWDDVRKDLRLPRYPNRDSFTIRYVRGSQTLETLWSRTQPSTLDIYDRLGMIWLPYVFWLFGTLCWRIIRPRDNTWVLMIAFDYLTALWLVTGVDSTEGRVWLSSIWLHMLVWWCLPVYFHLHWLLPRPLGKTPVKLLWLLYGAAAVFSTAEWFRWLPTSLYLLGFMLALLSSLALLLVHAFIRREQRGDLGLLALAAGLALLPMLAIGIAGAFLHRGTVNAAGALLLFPVIPGIYFYVLYRRQAGGLQPRTSRVLSLAIYAVLLYAVCALLIAVAYALADVPGTPEVSNIILPVIFAGVISILVYPAIQRWIEKHLLGMRQPPGGVVTTYSGNVAASVEYDNLARLLHDSVFPELQIRQAALLRFAEPGKDTPQALLLHGVSVEQLPNAGDLAGLLAGAGSPRLPPLDSQAAFACPWVVLALPLIVEKRLIGLGLFGRRDLDDAYAPAEIAALQSLMHQTALALVSIEQKQQLRALYQADILRQEQERTRLARDLHDDVLGQMTLLAQNVDERQAGKKFTPAYQAAVQRIRDLIGGLRPAMLNYGLYAALDEVVDDLIERATAAEDGQEIEVDLEQSALRYPENVELQLYRIVQQAGQNALKHAHARQIAIRGNLDAERVELVVEDDGVGFPAGEKLDLAGLLASGHYGLAGMHERAALAGARLEITSEPGKGTKVCVRWAAGLKT